MGQNRIGADLKYTSNIPDARTIHGHFEYEFSSAGLIAIVPVLKLKTPVAVSATITLMACFSFTIPDNVTDFLTVDTGNLNYSHALLKKSGIYQINSSDSLPNFSQAIRFISTKASHEY